MRRRTHRLWILPPPENPLTPTAARHWLPRVYPKLPNLAALGRAPARGRGQHRKERAGRRQRRPVAR